MPTLGAGGEIVVACRQAAMAHPIMVPMRTPTVNVEIVLRSSDADELQIAGPRLAVFLVYLDRIFDAVTLF